MLETLPHGSGINGDWICEVKSDSLVFSNDYFAMSNGSYCHTIRFWITIPIVNNSIQFDKWQLESDADTQEETPIESDEEGETCGCLYEIDTYLEDCFIDYFEDLTRYVLAVDLNERGVFMAHVENKILDSFDVFSYESGEEGIDLVNDGYMKHATDERGLELFLKDMKILDQFESIWSVRE